LRGPKVTLTLQEREETTSDGMGGYTDDWTDVVNGKIRGVLTTVSASERFATDKDTLYITHRFFCNKPGVTVTEKNRFTYGSRTFDIMFPDDLAEKGAFLEIGLKEIK